MLPPFCRASEPQEISQIHSLKLCLQQCNDEEQLVDNQIAHCREVLRDLTENQENLLYPFLTSLSRGLLTSLAVCNPRSNQYLRGGTWLLWKWPGKIYMVAV